MSFCVFTSAVCFLYSSQRWRLRSMYCLKFFLQISHWYGVVKPWFFTRCFRRSCLYAYFRSGQYWQSNAIKIKEWKKQSISSSNKKRIQSLRFSPVCCLICTSMFLLGISIEQNVHWTNFPPQFFFLCTLSECQKNQFIFHKKRNSHIIVLLLCLFKLTFELKILPQSSQLYLTFWWISKCRRKTWACRKVSGHSRKIKTVHYTRMFKRRR